jgi:LemA protein
MAHAPALRFARPLAAFALITLCLTLAGCGINTIPTYEQDTKAAWSEVLNQYKWRADLIPNLVESAPCAPIIPS